MSETTIDSLIIEIEGRSNGAAGQIDQLAGALEKLKSSAALTRVTNNLNKLSTALSGLSRNSAGLSNINALANSLKSLEGIGKVTNLASALNQLKKVPDILKSLDTATITQFAARMKELGNALAPLSTQIDRLSNGFGRLPNRIKSCVAATTQMSRGATTVTAGLGGMYNTLGRASIYGLSLQRVGHAIAGWINEMNGYIENVNLFTVTMGEYAEEAMKYAETVQDMMGIDASEWIRNQSIFMNMANGFGLARDKAYQLSRGLTELAYDISSFYNQDMDTVFQRLQSGIAGEIEPVRRWGIALDQASMKQWMLKNGIDANINSLTQADKAMIRYNMTVETMVSNGAIGDFARTLITPANALRVLQQQVTQLSRALGSLFIPMLIAVLPYIQAFVKVVTSAVRALAALFGFKMPEIDYSGIGGAAGGVGDVADAAGDATKNLGSAAKKAKELKNATLGFDELNVISPPTDNAGAGGGSGGAGGVGSGGLGLEPLDVWDKSIFDAISSKVDSLMPKMKVLFDVILAIGAGLAAWKISKAFLTSLATLLGVAPNLKNIALLAAGVGLAVGGMVLEFEGIADAIKNGLNKINATEILAGGAAIIAGGALIGKAVGGTLASTLIGAAIGGIIAGAGMIFIGIRDALKNGLNPLNATMTALGTTLIGALIGAMIGGPGGALIGAGIGLLVGLIADGIILIREKWDAIKDYFKGLWKSVKNIFQETIPQIVDDTVNWFKELPGKVVQKFNEIITKLGEWKDAAVAWIALHVSNIVDDIIDWFVTLPHRVGVEVGKILGTLANWKDSVVNWITVELPKIIGKIVDWFAKLPGRVYDKIIEIKTKLSEWKTNVTTWFKEHVTNIVTSVTDWFAKLPGKILTKLNNFKEKIITWKNNAIQWFGTYIPKILNSVTDWFAKLPENMVNIGKNMMKGIWNGIVSLGSWFKKKVLGLFGKLGDIIGDLVGDFGSGVKEGYVSVRKFAKGGVLEDGLFTMNKGEIAGKFKNGKSVVANNMQIIKGISDGVTNGINQAIGNDFRYYMQIVSTLMSQIKSTVTKSVTDTAKNLTDMGRDIKVILDSALGTIGGQIDGLKSTLDSGFSSVSSAISSLESALGDLKLSDGNESQDSFWGDSTLGEMIDSGELNLGTFVEIAGNPVRRPISRFADGGFIEDGIFTMNRGEIAGKFSNGKSVVANNEQIIEGISEGVYEAMMRASSSDDNDKPLNVNVYLDGKQIAKSVEKRNSEKGRSLLGNGLGYNY